MLGVKLNRVSKRGSWTYRPMVNFDQCDTNRVSSIDRSRYYYSHLVAARGRGSRKPRVRVVWTNMTKECEVKCKYHWDIVQNKYENLMILHIRIICGEDLFSMGIYRLIKTKIYFTVCISMYVKSSVPACTWLILQRPLTATSWL